MHEYLLKVLVHFFAHFPLKSLTKYKKIAAKPLVEGGVVMNTHANKMKSCLLETIKEMASTALLN